MGTLSGRRQRKKHSRWKVFSLESQGFGRAILWASLLSKTALNSTRFAANPSDSPLKVGSRESAKISCQALSVSQAGAGLSFSIATPVGPANKKRHSPVQDSKEMTGVNNKFLHSSLYQTAFSSAPLLSNGKFIDL